MILPPPADPLSSPVGGEMLCDGSVAVICFALSADWSATRLWQYTGVLKEQYNSVLKERLRRRGTHAMQ